MKLPIYMDNHATTPVDPQVLEVMLPYFSQEFGNAASKSHSFGHTAATAVDKAREQIAELIGANPNNIIFTSGATESDNLAIQGVAHFYKDKGRHIITAVNEHKAVLDTCQALQREGFDVTYVGIGIDGIVDPAHIREAIRPDTILVSIMMANNEIGTINPIAEIGAICQEHNVLFHCDAAQGAGKLPVNVDTMNIDLLSLSAHKMYGPKGVGALYVRSRPQRVRLSPIIHGGGHERGMRSGTLNVPGIVGMGEAAHLCRLHMEEENARLLTLRTRMKDSIFSRLEHVKVNGDLQKRLPGNLNISFSCVEGESLMLALKGIAVSSGSACSSASLEPSYVLHAMGIGDDLAHSSIRFGLGRFNTEEEVDYVADQVVEQVNKLRAMSPLWEMVQAGIDPSTIKWV